MKENKYKFSKMVRKYLIHERLKSSRCISQAKWHDFELIVTLMGFEGSLINVFCSHSNLMVSSPEVQFREIFCPMQFIKQLIYYRNGVFILNSELIQISVINTEPPCSILRLYQNNRAPTKWALTVLDNACLHHFLHYSFHFCLLHIRAPIRS